jgi:hypothetical protein
MGMRERGVKARTLARCPAGRIVLQRRHADSGSAGLQLHPTDRGAILLTEPPPAFEPRQGAGRGW